MIARFTKLAARLIAAVRTVGQPLVSAIRGRAFRLIAGLYRAIDGGQAVAITYVKPDGARSQRVIEPQSLALSAAGDITVRAYDRLRGEDRTFRVDRIEGADFPESATTPAEQGAAVQTTDAAQDTAYAIIRDLDQAWTDLVRIQLQFAADRWDSWEDRYNSVGYMQTARRAIARHRAELDAYRAGVAASEERVNRLADVARDTGLLKDTAVAYLVYGPAVLAEAA